MKNLAKLNGAKALSKEEQKSINGGFFLKCFTRRDCRGGESCCSGNCIDLRTAIYMPEGCD